MDANTNAYYNIKRVFTNGLLLIDFFKWQMNFFKLAFANRILQMQMDFCKCTFENGLLLYTFANGLFANTFANGLFE